MSERAVILAISHPTHHSQLTHNRTHAMLPALGKPLIARIMYRLYTIGIRQYTVIVGENEGAVAAYLHTHWVPDAQIDFVLRFGNDSLLKVLRTVARKHHSPFLICGYNCFTHANFPESLLKLHRESPNDLIFGATAHMLSSSPEHDYALRTDGRITDIVHKSKDQQGDLSLINFAACGQEFIDYLCDMTDHQQSGGFTWQFMDIVSNYLRNGKTSITAETAWALQVETDYDLLTLNRHLLDEHRDAHILSELSYTVQIIPPVRIDPQVSVGQGAQIGPHVYLERGCSIGRQATIRNSIVLEKTSVPANQIVTNAIFTNRGPIW